MSKLVLVTGAFGNLGQKTVEAFVAHGYRVRAFDLPTRKNRLLALRLPKTVEVLYGDVTRDEDVRRAVSGVDAIVHGAALMPPTSEKIPEVARRVNVEGTRRMLRMAEEARVPGPFVFASSFAIFGPHPAGSPLVTVDSPVVATDHYTAHKIECEALIREAKLPWVLFRIGVMAEGNQSAADPDVFRMMFEIAPDSPMELVHATDVALATVRAVERPEAHGKVLLLGGGKRCQVTNGDMFEVACRAMGLDRFPREAFGDKAYNTCWMDTSESQRILEFQRHSFEDIAGEILGRVRFLTPLLWPLRPILRRYLLGLSEPYRKSHGSA